MLSGILEMRIRWKNATEILTTLIKEE